MTRAELEKRLRDELKRTGDPRLVDGGNFFESPPISDPFTEEVPPATKQGKSR